MIDFQESFISEDLDALAEIFNPLEEKTDNLEDGENRVVSVLFMDIQGFTALSEKLKPEDVKITMDKVLTVFTNSIVKYGGYIDKYEGDLIMALFGSKTASESDTERAISAGMKILADLKQINQILGFDLAVRIGINTGLVTTGKVGMKREGDFTVYGDSVNIARRMEENAPINSIMIPSETKSIVEDRFKFEDLGSITVKGKAETISVWKVVGQTTSKVERWERKNRMIKQSIFVGRDNELKKASDLYTLSNTEIGTADPNYKPVIIGLKGQAGIGKSRFVKNWVKEIGAQETTMFGYTKSFAQGPYFLFSTLLKGYFEIGDSDNRDSIRRKLDAHFDRMIQFLGESFRITLREAKSLIGYLFGVDYQDPRLEKADPKTVQTLMIHSIRHTLGAIAHHINLHERKPLLLFFDDCQWFDESSCAALQTFLSALNVEEKREGLANQNLVIVMTYRPEFELLPEFNYDARWNEFELQPFQAKDTRKMIEALVGENRFDDHFIQMLQERSGGNPFYLEELIGYLYDKGDIRYEKGMAVILKELDHSDIPLSLRNIILSRIDHLGDSPKMALLRASVIGYRFSRSVLEAVSMQLDPDSHIDVDLKELVSDQWVFNRTEEDYFFRHVLTANICYETMLTYNKRIIHRIVATSMEELYKDDLKSVYADLADHYEKAGIDEKTRDYLDKAASQARENYQNEKALDLYDRLLKRLNDTKDEEKAILILLSQAEIMELIGKWDDAEKRYEEVLKLSQKKDYRTLLVDCMTLFGFFLENRGESQRAEVMLQQSLTMAESMNDTQRIGNAIGNMGIVYWNQGNYGKAMDCFRKKLSICERLEDKYGIGLSIGRIGNVYHFRGEAEKAMECYEKQLAICEELGDKRGISCAIGNMGVVYQQHGDYEKAMECYQKQLTLCEELGDKRELSYAVGNMGNVYWNQGFFQKAMESYGKLLAISEVLGDKRGSSRALGNMGLYHRTQGAYDKAMDCYERQLAICEELGDKSGISYAIGNLGMIHKDLGQLEKAMKCYEKQLAICEEIGDTAGISHAVGFLGNVHRDRCHFDEALEYYKKKLAISQQLEDEKGISRAFGSMGLVHWNQGHIETAMECYEKQRSICEELGDKKGLSLALGSIALAYWYQEAHKLALASYDQAIQISRDLNIKRDLAEQLLNKATMLYEMGKIEDAELVNKEAYSIAEEINKSDVFFHSKVLKHKISGNIISIVKEVENSNFDDEKMIDLFYYLWINTEESVYREKACKGYEILFKDKQLDKYKTRINACKQSVGDS